MMEAEAGMTEASARMAKDGLAEIKTAWMTRQPGQDKK
jgi:hypothetical protein